MMELQDKMLEMEQAEITTKHRFTDGVYSREITIPRDVCLIGAKHLTRHFFIISKGKCIINDGKSTEILESPYHGITEIGTKRAILAMEDTVFTTFHVTNETDIDKIEKDIIEPEGLKIQNNPLKVIK